MESFEREDLQVSYVQMAPMALYNYLLFDRPDLAGSDKRATVIVNIGAESTDLVVCTASGVWQRCIMMGGNAFTKAIAETFKLSFEKAEKLKRTAPVSKYARQIFQAMRPVVHRLERRSPAVARASTPARNPDVKVTRVIAMGGGTKLRGPGQVPQPDTADSGGEAGRLQAAGGGAGRLGRQVPRERERFRRRVRPRPAGPGHGPDREQPAAQEHGPVDGLGGQDEVLHRGGGHAVGRVSACAWDASCLDKVNYTPQATDHDAPEQTRVAKPTPRRPRPAASRTRKAEFQDRMKKDVRVVPLSGGHSRGSTRSSSPRCRTPRPIRSSGTSTTPSRGATSPRSSSSRVRSENSSS